MWKLTLSVKFIFESVRDRGNPLTYSLKLLAE